MMSAKSVTRRYPGQAPSDTAQVTQKYSEKPKQVTQHYVIASPEKTKAKRPGLAGNTLIADRYRVQDGPLGETSGEADVYECVDEVNKQTVAVKLYYHQAVPKADVLLILQQLDHPNVVSIYRHGEWQARFYEVMEFCAGGVMSEYMPLSETELRQSLSGLIHALDHCHRQGVIHRDIKPNNLFFNNAEQRLPLISDFGISSYLQQNDKIRRTQSAANLTLDYAAPELLDGHVVSAKTDYYSLGITLLHLLRGRSPFHGLNQNDILVSHLRGRVSLPSDLSLEFHRLLRGLTLPSQDDRWGYEQVLAWLRGENVPLHLDSLQQADPDKGSKPYPGYPQARTAASLASSLDRFDALKQLQRGDIRRWVFDNINQNLAEQIETLETTCDARPQMALYKLRCLLDPDTPLPVGEHRVKTLHTLLNLIKQAATDSELAQQLSTALWDEYLESWLISSKPAGTHNSKLVEKITALRKRLHYKANNAALFALRYTLEPQSPVQINDALQLTAPQALPALFKAERKTVLSFLTPFIYSKRFEEWLRAAEFPNWQDDLRFIEATRRLYLDKKKIGTYCILWHYYPDLPLPFAGQQITDPLMLANLIDSSSQNTLKGLTLLTEGWLRAWLVGSGKITTPVELDHALLNIENNSKSKLEAVLHILNPQLAFPIVHSNRTEFNFGQLYYGERKTIDDWVLSNRKRGYLNGEITLAHYGEGLLLNKYVIEGNYQHYQVTVEAMDTLQKGLHHNVLQVHSNGGDMDIPIRFVVRSEPEEVLPWWQRVLDYFFA